MKRFFNILTYITLVLTTILVVQALYLTYFPFKVVELIKFETAKKVVKRGETLQYVLDFKKNYNFIAQVKYFLVDGIIVSMEDGSTHRSIGSFTVKNEKVIPTTILPGNYKMRIEMTYKISLWRDLVYVWESNYFRVE